MIVTTGQPSTNPRMVKEYKALKQEGWNVKVLYSFWTNWASETDKQLFHSGELDRRDFKMVAGSPSKNKFNYLFSKVLLKTARLFSTSDYAISRVAYNLEQAALKDQADVYIGHNLGALRAVVKAAQKFSAKAVFDVEDFYSGQYNNRATADYKASKQVENKYLPSCDALLFSSREIKDGYSTTSGKTQEVILNVVERKFVCDSIAQLPLMPVKLAWFSQTIGANRGIETVVEALNMLEQFDYELHLLGNCSSDYKASLQRLSNRPAALHFHEPVPYSEISNFLADKHIGLATETARDENNDRALSNKLFSYLAAGNAIVASDTTAQRNFITQHNGIGFIYKKNDKADCSALLHNLFTNAAKVSDARAAALQLAQQSMNWDVESKKLVQLLGSL